MYSCKVEFMKKIILSGLKLTVAAMGTAFMLSSTFNSSAHAATIVLDQENVGEVTLSQGVGGRPGSYGDPVIAQSFTAGIAGTLASIDVSLHRNTHTVFGIDLVAEIFPVADGIPVGSALGSVTIPELSIPETSSSFFNIDLSAFNIPVNVGTQLALVVHDSNKADQNTVYGWVGSNSDSYTGGSRSYDVGNGFTNTSTDLYFRTYVTQLTDSTPVPEPTAIFGLLSLGIFGGASTLKRKKNTHGKTDC